MDIRNVFLEDDPRRRGRFYRKSYRLIDSPSFDIISISSPALNTALGGVMCVMGVNVSGKKESSITLQVVTWNFLGRGRGRGGGGGGCRVKLCSCWFLDNRGADVKMYERICLPFPC